MISFFDATGHKVRLVDGIRLDLDLSVVDECQRRYLDLTDDQERVLLDLVNMTAARLNSMAGSDWMVLVQLGDAGIVTMDLGRFPLLRGLWLTLRQGDPTFVRVAIRCGTRRYRSIGSWQTLFFAWRAVWRAYGVFAVTCTAIMTVLALLTGENWAGTLVDSSALVVVLTTFTLHEWSHCAATRLVLRDARCCAYRSGPGWLSVVRPELSGWRLRVVAASGPVVGLAASLVIMMMVSPWWFMFGATSAILHLSNLVPSTPDGHQVWSGQENHTVRPQTPTRPARDSRTMKS